MNLKIGDEVRVIAPSRSLEILSEETIDIATKRLEQRGLTVSFGKNIMNTDPDFNSASIEERISDLHDAFTNTNIKAILTGIGGFLSNQLLKYIDYDLIKKNPKILCGFSDITALLNAIYAKTGLITFYGPHFSSLGMKKGCEYTLEYFDKMFFEETGLTVKSSKEYSDDLWFIDQEKRTFLKNEGMKIINEGVAEGTLIGGNLNTFNLLQGTEFMPSLKNSILFLEDDESAKELFFQEFDRNLESLIQLPDFKEVKALILGRSQISCNMSDTKWRKLIQNKEELKNIPVIFDCDFGHTTPILTIPIGGYCKLEALNGKINLTIKK